MKYSKTIRISKEKLDEGNRILNMFLSDGGKYSICNVTFPNDFQVDIEIDKNKESWVKGVLFDLMGNQVGNSENDETQILGEYYFSDSVNEYFVFVENEDL